MKKKILAAVLVAMAMVICACSGEKGSGAATSGQNEVAKETDTTQSEESEIDGAESGNSKTTDNPVDAVMEQVDGSINNAISQLENSILEFSGMDLFGNAISNESFFGKKLVMINFWESWCGPCVNEMPEIQKLYEDYEEQGFAVLGVYSTPNDERNVKAIVEKTGVKYPTIYLPESMIPLLTDYVPATYFLDGEGHILNLKDPHIGSLDYSGWEEVIKSYFDKLQ